MAQEFSPNSNESGCPNSDSALSEQEISQVTVTSSRDGVIQIIRTLYRLGFAEIGDWSPLQRGAKPGEMVSVSIRRHKRQARSSSAK